MVDDEDAFRRGVEEVRVSLERLEATLGLQLIIRNPRGMELTPAGEVFRAAGVDDRRGGYISEDVR